MDGWIGGVTPEELKIFHGLDRELYTILVRDLSRNPTECLQIMGFWLWLERGGFSNLISRILSLQHFLINKACEEALTCLNLIKNTQCPAPSATADSLIPLTRRLLKTEVSLNYFRENGLTIFHRVQNLISEVYIPALSDIMERARNGEFSKSPDQNESAVSVSSPSMLPGYASQVRALSPAQNEPAVSVSSPPMQPGYASQVRALSPAQNEPAVSVSSPPMLPGYASQVRALIPAENELAISVSSPSMLPGYASQVRALSPAQNESAISVSSPSMLPGYASQVRALSPAQNESAISVSSPSMLPGYVSQVRALTLDDLIARAFSGLSFGGGGGDTCEARQASRFSRTMFVTFSKGYPVTESEVSEFFTRLFGNCIESLYMQEVGPDEQALYARIVFVNPSYIQFILNGEGKAKFSINGKHVWMRQFVPRNGRMWPCGCPTVGPLVCPHQY